MFIELSKKKTDILYSGGKTWLRFDNKAFLEIEKSGFNPFEIKEINDNPKAARAFLTAGLRDYCDVKGTDRNNLVNELLSGNSGEVFLLMLSAILDALPKDSKGKSDGKATAENIYTLFCDVMKCSEEEFWRSTLREIAERCDRYCIFMGYKEAPIQISRYDE